MVQADAFPNRLQELTDILVTCGELLAQSFKPLLILDRVIFCTTFCIGSTTENYFK